MYLVGAGPGDPGLLTIRGLECLQAADYVLYDGLASEQLLEFASQAVCISVGKHGQVPIWSQADINVKMLELAQAGARVVRLKGGDPAVFARTAEELEVLTKHAIAFEVVPGITAALAAASYVGIPITHRHHASAVAFITGQQQLGEPPQAIDWTALARFPGTLVFYMGVTTVQEWTSQLMAAGKPIETPSAIVRRCTWPDQQVIRCTLGEVAGHLTPASRMRPPVIVIVGSVAALGEQCDWFSNRPLHGCSVLVTRAQEQQDRLVGPLRALGAEVFQQPVFSVGPPDDLQPLDGAIEELAKGTVSGITFSSSHGVDGVLRRVFDRGRDARIFAGVDMAAVGNATARQLARYGLRCDIVPPAGVEQSAAGLLSVLAARSVVGQRWWVTTTQRSRPHLREGLVAMGAEVAECLAYATHAVADLKALVKTALQADRLNYVTITSSFVAEATHALLGEDRRRVLPVAIGRSVAERLAALDWPAVAVADEHSSESLIQAIESHWRMAAKSWDSP